MLWIVYGFISVTLSAHWYGPKTFISAKGKVGIPQINLYQVKLKTSALMWASELKFLHCFF